MGATGCAQVVTAWSQLQAAEAALESDITAVEATASRSPGVRERRSAAPLLDVLTPSRALNSEATSPRRRNILVAS